MRNIGLIDDFILDNEVVSYDANTDVTTRGIWIDEDDYGKLYELILNLSVGKKLEDDDSDCNLAGVMPMLRVISGIIDRTIADTLTDDESTLLQISDVVEYLRGMYEDNDMFIRN